MGYLWGFWLLLTTLTVLVLKFFDPEKARPSIDDGASAPEHTSMPQRIANAVSLKNMAQRMLHCLSSALPFTACLVQPC